MLINSPSREENHKVTLMREHCQPCAIWLFNIVLQTEISKINNLKMHFGFFGNCEGGHISIHIKFHFTQGITIHIHWEIVWQDASFRFQLWISLCHFSNFISYFQCWSWRGIKVQLWKLEVDSEQRVKQHCSQREQRCHSFFPIIFWTNTRKSHEYI